MNPIDAFKNQPTSGAVTWNLAPLSELAPDGWLTFPVPDRTAAMGSLHLYLGDPFEERQ